MKPNSRRRSTPGTSSSPKQGGNRESEDIEASEDSEDSETWRIRDSENSENSRNRDPEACQVSHDLPPLATRICSLPEAVCITLQAPQGADLLFRYGRALRAFESTTGIRFPKNELDNAFNLFWAHAKGRFPADADSDEYRLAFLVTFPKVRAPLGSNPLDEAMKRACTEVPSAASRYPSARIRLLVALCFHLQVLSENSPFFLSVRSVMECLGLKSTHQASNLLNGLVMEGILECVEKGRHGVGRASRFRYVGRIPGRGQA